MNAFEYMLGNSMEEMLDRGSDPRLVVELIDL